MADARAAKMRVELRGDGLAGLPVGAVQRIPAFWAAR
jgi:hypothetical protein